MRFLVPRNDKTETILLNLMTWNASMGTLSLKSHNMKKNILVSIKISLAFFCLIIWSNTSAQNKKTASKTIFGKAVKIGNVNPNNGKIRCATVEYEEFLQRKNSKRRTNAQFENWIAPLVEKRKAMRTTSQSGGIITIPVVVHVIHSGQAIGTAPNITDAQVQSQITVLNEDFSTIGQGSSANPVNVGAATNIRFALAKQDPNGNPTNGIDRVSFCQESWSPNNDDIELNVKPATIWDPTQYLNIWTINLVDDTLGYAQLPEASGLGGLGSGGNSNTDGVVCRYSAFGSSTHNNGSFLLNNPYDKGRTMTHEVGHWLGLIHIWGDSACGNDFCADTPVHHDANYGCPTVANCNNTGNEMVENYMDYTDDACMNIFTQNQKERMDVIINNAARRKELITSTKNTPLTLFANDAEVKVEANCSDVACFAGQKITIYNRGTNNLTAATLNYTINGGSNTSYNWVGNLTTHQSATFILPINSPTSATINVNITSVNGGADARNTNNTASGTFIPPTTAPNYTFTNFIFKLQLDLFGTETTWLLKNSSGTILFSGGPYPDKKTLPLPNALSFPWTLANNECYTFIINDGGVDGICCGGGNGSYSIESSDGSSIIKSGGTFSLYETTRFTTSSLGAKAFETSNDIYLYPNPTKGKLNIRIPSNFDLPNSFIISNNLGQKISQKVITKENDLTINTSDLSNGIYFITIVKEGQKKTLKFIKE